MLVLSLIIVAFTSAPLVGVLIGWLIYGRPDRFQWVSLGISYGAVVLCFGPALAFGGIVDAIVVLALWGCWLLAAAPILGVVLLASAADLARPSSQNRCPHCRYDLGGNLSGICPECGARIR